MNPERWRKARELFDEAIEKESAARVAYLDKACDGDRELREIVDRLLADATEAVETWLESGVSEHLVRRAMNQQSLEGETIDDYLIRGVLGSGGMATVLEAEQQHPKRTVALKIMRFGLLSDVARRRFEYESEILGGLRHPGIAQVFATGTHRDKMSGLELPYFAMEFIEGARPLNLYVEEEEPGLAAMLRLFVTVCKAVHYGHQRGFIHRDLKPQNILVDDQGLPKIIDFGIARATAPESDERTLYTQQGEILGTLNYMSPEQVETDEHGIDLRCDVYALGVILFELATGRLPFILEGKPITAAISTIQHDEPPLASSLGSRFADLPQSEDLDWVILKAMDKDRERRYASATELAADIERILVDEPILARPPSKLYLSKKFIKRHRVGVSAAAIVLVSLIAGITMTSISLGRAVEAEQESRLAEQEATEALDVALREIGTHRAVNRFLSDMLSSVSPYEDGLDVKVIDVLDRASKTADQLYGDRPDWQAALHMTLGNTFFGLGQFEPARDHLELAVELSRDHLEPDNSVTLTSLHNLGTCYSALGRLDEAEDLVTEALEGRLLVSGPNSEDVAHSSLVLAQIAYKKNDLETAATRFADAGELFLEVFGPGARFTVLANTGLGLVFDALGRDAEAEELFRSSVVNGGQGLGEEHPTVLSAKQALAALLSARGELAEATEMLRGNLEIEERVLGANHDNTLNTLNSLATALQRQGQLSQAEKMYRELIARRRQKGQYADLVTAAALNNLGVCLESQDRLEEAEASIQEALGLLSEMQFPVGHWLPAAFRKALAVVRIKQERYAEAETMLKDSISIFEGSAGDHTPRIQKAIEALVTLYDAWQKPELAQEMRQRLLVR